MNSTSLSEDSTAAPQPTNHEAAPRLVDDVPSVLSRDPLRHEGRYCGRREVCWRVECVERWPGFATVEVLADGEVIARCHGSRFYPRAFRAAVAS